MDFGLKSEGFRAESEGFGAEHSALFRNHLTKLDEVYGPNILCVARHDVFPVAKVPSNCMDKADNGSKQWKA